MSLATIPNSDYGDDRCCECKIDEITRRKLRVNIKSLAAEAVFIRKEAKKATDSEVARTLTLHRTGSVRMEARAAQLLLAYLQGKEHKDVEPKTSPMDYCHHSKLLKSVKSKAKKMWANVDGFEEWFMVSIL